MFQRMPVVTKNLIIINAILFFVGELFINTGLKYWLAGWYFEGGYFRGWQIITHMFMHGSFTHILFNMFGVYMFGSALENAWGPKRYLNYYLICGLGAFGLHEFIQYLEIRKMMEALPAAQVQEVILNGFNNLQNGLGYTNEAMQELNQAINLSSVVGASGCLFGVLLAFGMLYPNVELMLLFFPVPIKAKWFVLIYGGIEFFQAFQNRQGDNVAHFAHLGGMLFGYIIIKIWQAQGKSLR